MSIKNITTNFTGQVGVEPRMVRIETTNTLAEVTAVDFLKDQIHQFQPEDAALVSLSDNSTKLLNISISGGSITLVAETGGVKLPVVDGDFAQFSGTDGLIEDKGYSPSNAAKTKVIMANGPTVINQAAAFSDVSGTIKSGAPTLTNPGNFNAGSSGIAGKVSSFPGTAAKGFFSLEAVENVDDTETKIQNAPMGQSTNLTIPDPGVVGASFLIAPLAIADVSENVVNFVVTATAAQLAGLAKVTIIPAGTLKRYQILDIFLDTGPGLDAGGDRNLQIVDSVNLYSFMPAAIAITPLNTRWGDPVNLTLPSGIGVSEPTVAGSELSLQAVAGTTDYTSGSLTISVTAIRVA